MSIKSLYIILLSLFILSSFNSHIENNQDKLLWNKNEKLKWVDFQGKPNEEASSLLIASTQTSIEIIESSYKDGIPVFKIGSFFIRQASWTKVDDTYTLSHEQLHFDIAEIYARKIRKEYKRLNDNEVIDISVYQKVYDSLIDKTNEYNKRYDSEVYFNEERQALWSEKIKDELEELKEYEYLP